MKPTKLKIWADSVKGRDGKCLECGTTDDLHAHHIKPKASHPDLTLVVENGKTLCYRCHKTEHERNRPVRIRSNRPNRKTLESRMAWLKERVDQLETEVGKLRHEKGRLSSHVDVCKRGACKSSLNLLRKYQNLA